MTTINVRSFNKICDEIPITKLPNAKTLKMTLTVSTHFGGILFQLVEEVLSKLIVAGIPMHFIDEGLWRFSKQKVKTIVDNSRILTLGDLEFGFVLWCAACVISILAFLSEIFWLSFSSELKKLQRCINFMHFIRVSMIKMTVYNV